MHCSCLDFHQRYLCRYGHISKALSSCVLSYMRKKRKRQTQKHKTQKHKS
jgi:hypothetical protein